MLNIAICDDEPIFINMLEDAIQHLCIIENLECDIIKFSSSTEILNDSTNYDILLLDIELGDECNGIEVGRKLRDRGHIAKIIFVTSHGQWSKEGYMVSPHRFIDKPVKQAEINEAIMSAIKLLCNERRLIAIKYGATDLLIPIQQIELIETSMRNRLLKVWNGKDIYLQKTTLRWEQLTELLPSPQFAFIQKSFLINQSFLKSRTATTVVLEHLGEYNISKRYVGIFNKMYQKHIERGR